MSVTEKESRFDKIIDCVGLVSIGIICFLYSLFWSNFAEIHITLPFLNFPIFVGEILLFWCTILLILKWRTTKLKFGYKYWLLLLYVIWVLLRALHGYIEWGPLALRNAALFYYPFFAVIGYHFYREGFFNQKTVGILFVVFMAVKIIMDKSLIFYFFTPYLLLSIVLALKMKLRWIKYPALMIVLFLFPYKNFLQGSRSFIIANFSVALFLFFVGIFMTSKFRKTTKVFGLILFFIVLTFAFLKFSPPEKVTSLMTPRYLIEEIRVYDQMIQKSKKTYVPRQIPVQIYNSNKKEIVQGNLIEQERIMREVRDKVRVIKEEIEYKIEQERITHEVRDKVRIIKEEIEREIEQERITHEVRDEVRVVREEIARKIEKDIDSNPGLTKVQQAGHKDVQLSMTEIRNRQQSQQNLVEKENTYFRIFQVEKEDIRKKVFLEKKENEVSHGMMIIFDREFDTSVRASIDSLIQRKEIVFGRTMQTEYANILFRLFIWRDMFTEVIREKAWLGFSFGKPQRSISLENAGFAAGEWGRDGWIASHNAFFHMIYRAGILGFCMVLGIFASLFMMIKKFSGKKFLEELLLVAVLIYWLVLSNFLVVLELPYQAIPFWALFGMILAHQHNGRMGINQVRG